MMFLSCRTQRNTSRVVSESYEHKDAIAYFFRYRIALQAYVVAAGNLCIIVDFHSHNHRFAQMYGCCLADVFSKASRCIIYHQYPELKAVRSYLERTIDIVKIEDIRKTCVLESNSHVVHPLW